MKKIILGSISTLSLICAPTAMVVSCSKNHEKSVFAKKDISNKLSNIQYKEGLDSLKKSFINKFQDKKKNLKGDDFSPKDFQSILDAQTGAEAKKAAEKIEAFTPALEEVNTAFRVGGSNKLEVDGIIFMVKPGTKIIVHEKGKKDSPKHTMTEEEFIIGFHNNAKIQTVKQLADKIDGDNLADEKGATIDSSSFASETDLKEALKKLKTLLVNRAQVPEKQQMNTQLEIQDLLTNGPLMVNLGKFIPLKKPDGTAAETNDELELFVIVKGHAAQIAKKQVLTFSTDLKESALANYKKDLKEIIKDYVKKDRTTFQDDDLITIDNSKTHDAALLAAKKIEVWE